MRQSPNLVFPKIKRVELNNFSLYTLTSKIEVDISDGVFCLAGANGLGKSTFLTALNFAITGIVPEPERKFVSVNEYYEYCLDYNKNFFSGRITEEDREAASITIHFQVGNFLYVLTRAVFEKEGLRELIITDTDTGQVILNKKELSGVEYWKDYQERLANDIGLANFKQFVFLQFFVFTFDERRHLLLWDQIALTQALFIGIGSDYESAQLADNLRRERDKAASLARNRSYQASNVRGRIEEIKKIMKASKLDADPEELEEIDKKHKEIQERFHDLELKFTNKRKQLDDADLKWMESSAKITSLQNEYTKTFSQYTNKQKIISFHPLITDTFAKSKCALCGNEKDGIVESIKQKIDDDKCPLCNSQVQSVGNDSNAMKRLKELDSQIIGVKKQLNSRLKTKERLYVELQQAESQIEATKINLNEFESENEDLLNQIRSETSGIVDTLKNLYEEMELHLAVKRKKYRERDDIQKNLNKLLKDLERSYAAAEKDFVPLFQDLALLFLGIDLIVRMDSSTSVVSSGFSFALEVRGSVRRQIDQLSESQRFFLDIALRMALAQYMSAESREACLFIDTPEGSLDIAYESRAGQMFAQFVSTGHDIIMTANLNSSKILRKLASDCGRAKMKLHRMMSWTELSDVQIVEEQLFHEAYEDIERALDSKKS